MKLARLAVAALTIAVVSAHACSDLPTGAETPFSLSFGSAPSPGIVLGDTMRDSTGAAAKLSARIFNLEGEELTGARAGYFLVGPPDSQPVTLSADGYLVAKSDTIWAGRTFRVVALALGDSSLQSPPLTITVTRPPTTLTATPGIDTVRLLGDSIVLAPVTMVLEQVVIENGVTRERPVPAYTVRFTFVEPPLSPTDTAFLAFTDGGRLTTVDTTDGSGTASRSVRIRRAAFPRGTSGQLDTMTVRMRATARYRATVISATKTLFLRLNAR